MKLYFVSVNDFKAIETKGYFEGSGIELEVAKLNIQEILNKELDIIVKDKVLKAYKQIRLPCAVEHGGLFIDSLNGLPGGLSKVVWDNVEDKLCSFIPKGQSRGATAKSVIGYCNGKNIFLFTGETRGTISEIGRGNYKFQWDPIFIPQGSKKTYAELGFPLKKEFSQARKAWIQLIDDLRGSTK